MTGRLNALVVERADGDIVSATVQDASAGDLAMPKVLNTAWLKENGFTVEKGKVSLA